MFNSENNVNLLWETLIENVIPVHDNNTKELFLRHIAHVSNNNKNLSLSDMNKKFLDEFIVIYNKNNAENQSFDNLLNARQKEFNSLMNVEKPKTLKIGDTIEKESNIDIATKLREFQNKRNQEPWLADYEQQQPEIKPVVDSTATSLEPTNIAENFMQKLKIEDIATSNEVPVRPIDMEKKVSFINDPDETDFKKADIINELNEIKRKVSNLINILETA